MANLLNPGKDARKAQEAAQRQQLAQLAAQQAEVNQAGATGGGRRGSRLLNFAQQGTLLSGDGQATLG